MRIQCLICDGVLKAYTAVCPNCGSRYRRGELIEEGHVKKRVAPKKRIGLASNAPIDFEHLPFTHNETRGETREEAIKNMFVTFNQYHGKRRKPAEEVFDILKCIRVKGVGWVITVRKK